MQMFPIDSVQVLEYCYNYYVKIYHDHCAIYGMIIIQPIASLIPSLRPSMNCLLLVRKKENFAYYYN